MTTLNRLRRAAQWPLYSPARLTLTALVLLALAATLLVLARAQHPPAKPDPGKSAPAPTPTAPEKEQSSPPMEDTRAAMRTAEEFVTAWASHPKTRTTWLERMHPHVDELFTEALATGEPDRVPAREVTGAAKRTETGRPGQTSAAVPTDAGPVTVDLSSGDGRTWHVTSIRPGAQPEPGTTKPKSSTGEGK